MCAEQRVGHSPAFQFYASDYLVGTTTMTLAERGAYMDCLAFQWSAGGVPGDDMQALSRVCRCTPSEARKVWPAVSGKFQRRDDGLWWNERLEQERAKQSAFRVSASNAGKASVAAKAQRAFNGRSTGVPVSLERNVNSSSSSSSSSSVPPLPKSGNGGPRARTALIQSPARHHKEHGDHVSEFCGWVCLPTLIVEGAVNRLIGAGKTEPEARDYVLAWARGVKAAWLESKAIPDADIFAFWRREWAASHKAKPATVATSDEWAKHMPGGEYDKQAGIA